MAQGEGGGRPPTYKEPQELYAHFEEYKEWTNNNPIKVHDFVGKDGQEVFRLRQRPLSFDGFCSYIFRTYKLYIAQYFEQSEGHYEKFIGICRAIKQEIRQEQIDGGMAGIYNPSITQRLNGLTEKVQHEGGDKPLFMNLDVSELKEDEGGK